MSPRKKTKEAPKKHEPLQAEKTSHEPSIHIAFTLENEDHLRRYLQYMASPKILFWRHFLAGSAHGLGFLLGSAIILTFISFFLGQFLAEIPFFSKFSEALDTWIRTQTMMR